MLDEYSMRGLVIDACHYLTTQLPEEAAELARKRARIEAHEFQAGDFPRPVKIALRIAATGVIVADIAMTGGTVTHLTMATGATIVL